MGRKKKNANDAKQITCKINEVEQLLISNQEENKTNLVENAKRNSSCPKMNENESFEFIIDLGSAYQLIKTEESSYADSEYSQVEGRMSKEEKEKLDQILQDNIIL